MSQIITTTPSITEIGVKLIEKNEVSHESKIPWKLKHISDYNIEEKLKTENVIFIEIPHVDPSDTTKILSDNVMTITIQKINMDPEQKSCVLRSYISTTMPTDWQKAISMFNDKAFFDFSNELNTASCGNVIWKDTNMTIIFNTYLSVEDFPTMESMIEYMYRTLTRYILPNLLLTMSVGSQLIEKYRMVLNGISIVVFKEKIGEFCKQKNLDDETTAQLRSGSIDSDSELYREFLKWFAADLATVYSGLQTMEDVVYRFIVFDIGDWAWSPKKVTDIVSIIDRTDKMLNQKNTINVGVYHSDITLPNDVALLHKNYQYMEVLKAIRNMDDIKTEEELKEMIVKYHSAISMMVNTAMASADAAEMAAEEHTSTVAQ